MLSNPDVTVALSGMGTIQMVEENALIASDTVSLAAEDRAAIETHVRRLIECEQVNCTGCKYCQPPEGVNIPYIFDMYNLGKVYGLWSVARENYATFPDNRWVGGTRADDCVECGECEEKCPQRLEIRELLKEAHTALS